MFNKISNKFPHRLIIYREGTSEGQFNSILENEVNPIRKSIENLKIDCKMVVVVVNKRVNAKIFSVGDNIRIGGPISGTVVDKEIVEPGSFLLVS